ncbi:hypothetical protein [Streptomyces sp. NPDC088141]|uniref:hypothetical protein n=1 Tax=Streptomyces sp. NPDC088141 TaxID=3155179 RepID=UPI0034137F74
MSSSLSIAYLGGHRLGRSLIRGLATGLSVGREALRDVDAMIGAAGRLGEDDRGKHAIDVSDIGASLGLGEAIPDGVLLSASEFTVGRQWAVHAHIGAHDVRQDQSIAGVGLLAGNTVAVAVADRDERAIHEPQPAPLPWLNP